MVAVDAQILAGVAVTVLLALLFFGVVVLWDVALALRGVADTVDKLEDTLDDDLTDLERAVDGTPGGGGAQVHLSGGGTISPGTAGPQTPPGQPGRGAGGQVDGAGRDARAARGRAQGNGHARSEGPRDGAAESPAATESAEAEPAVERPDSETAGAGPDRSPEQPTRSREAIGADPTPVRETPPEGTEVPARDGAEATAERDESQGDDADSGPDHPRASVNQGRFITSPDRTAWYRTPLDREAIAEARSPIAGELEAGVPATDEGSTEDDATVETRAPTDEEPIVVGPGGPDETVSGTESSDGEANLSANEGSSVETDSGAEGLPPDSQEQVDSAPTASESDDELEAETEHDTLQSDDEPGTDYSPGDDLDADSDESPTEDLGDAGSEAQPTENGGSSDEDGADEGRLAVSGAEEDASEAGDPAGGGASSENDVADAPSDEGDRDEVSGTDTAATATDPETAAADSDVSDETAVHDESVAQSPAESDDAFGPDEGLEFTFEEVTPADDPEPELTVDDAVDAVNDETPSLSRSAHGVESRAEVDDDGVVLVYDLEDSDASGSTKRLLRYQLQSFAAESDAAVDVAVSGNRVVVEIPGADGSDVSRWQSAIVEVIDRTLYLSDNSE